VNNHERHPANHQSDAGGWRHRPIRNWWSRRGLLIEKILSDKRETRRQLAGLPFAQKLELLEKLRDRSKLIAASSLRQRRHPSPRTPSADL